MFLEAAAFSRHLDSAFFVECYQFLTYPESLPYMCETIAEMDSQLEVIIQRISQAIQARDYDSKSDRIALSK